MVLMQLFLKLQLINSKAYNLVVALVGLGDQNVARIASRSAVLRPGASVI